MNFTSEEFRDSDEAWLAENVFSQFKDYSQINNVAIETDSRLNQHMFSRSDSTENLLKDVGRQGQINELLLEKNPSDEVAGNLLNCIKEESEFLNQENSSSVNQFIISQNRRNSVDNLNKDKCSNLDGKSFHATDDSQSFYQMLMTLPDFAKTDGVHKNVEKNQDEKGSQNGTCSIVNTSNLIKCMNCLQVFKNTSFVYHVCDYDCKKTLIPYSIINNNEPFPISSFLHPSNKFLRDRLIQEHREKLPVDPPCIHLLRENICKLRKFIKDELKIDLMSSAEKKLDGPHECTLCGKKFVHASGLCRHMEKHAMDLIPSTNSILNFASNQLKAMVKCLVCGRLFFRTTDAMDHLLKDHQNCKIAAGIEYEMHEFLNGDELTEEFVNFLIEKENQKVMKIESQKSSEKKERYLNVIIVKDVLQCEFCEYIFSDCSELLLHSADHDPTRGFECLSCEIKLPTSKEIFLHWQAECVFARTLIRDNFIIKRYFTCNVCENKFSSREQLTDHRYGVLHFFPRRQHIIDLMKIGCEYCGNTFEKIEHLVKHRQEKHLKKLIEKKGIERIDVQANDFGSSIQKLRQYLCDVCGKSYTQSSHLWQHLRFHRGVKPFTCKEPNCNRRFTIRPDLNDHIRKCHTGERPYQCQVCGKRFLTGSVYYQHRLIHRGDRRYACDECDKKFYRADALKNHMRIHTGEKPYGCLYCTKNFRQRGDRDKHIRARHAHLDENAKNVLTALKNLQPPPPPPPPLPKRNFMPFTCSQVFPDFKIKSEDIVYVGNVPFSSSVFQPILNDIDG